LIFAIAARDELWSGGRRFESRLTHGFARQDGDAIIAVDDADEALLAACEDAMVPARAVAQSIGARVRVVVRAMWDGLSSPSSGRVGEPVPYVETTFTVRIGGVSIVSTPEHIEADTELLRASLANRQPPTANRQLVWHNGSAAVLLHEAIGHAAEHGAPPAAWPEWLHVEAPLAPRRASFSDVPLPRMTHLIARQMNAPFELPEERVDVHLIAGGGYDPVSDVVTVHVAIPRFTIRASRAEIARSLRGATGQPIRYPGVICSREGQELHVPSAAPLMVTDLLIPRASAGSGNHAPR
jgi:hypothetical protein